MTRGRQLNAMVGRSLDAACWTRSPAVGALRVLEPGAARLRTGLSHNERASRGTAIGPAAAPNTVWS